MNAENLAKVMKQETDALKEMVGSSRGTSALRDIPLAVPSCSNEKRASTRSGRRS